VSVQIMAEPPLALPAPSPSNETASTDPTRIEITLPDSTCVRVGSGVGLVALRRVMAAVRR
jgi:transposase